MKKRNKKLVAMAACGMIAVVSAGASAAYLTDGETTTNTFTVGKVTIDLSEPNYTPEDDVPRVPNQEIQKDPTVANTGNNDEIVFVSFDIPMAEVRLAGHDGTVQEQPSNQELFDFRAGSGKYSSVNDGWVQIGNAVEVDEDNDGASDYMTYVYGYNKIVKAAVEAKAAVGNPGEDGYVAAVEAADATVVPSVFDYIRLANIVEGQLEGEKLKVPVRAYAIQSDFLQNSDNSELNDNIQVGDDMTEATLSQIFDIYKTQNSTEGANGALAAWTGINSMDAKQAGAGNVLDLIGEEH
ncbi:MAG: SipW-dependent-type signal peptide-containing protein [Lachnospiraceae bacterium]|nr:SipW-dependent-type signal peptide-containing protein [Lachnospiraceae bacterium]